MSTIAERVQAGCEWLDKIRPGWDRDIDLTVLDLSDCTVCVVGQLTDGESEAGIWALMADYPGDSDDAWPIELGFNDVEEQYEALTGEWYRVIRARRQAPQS